MVNADPVDEEDPPANNGDLHPFHGPVVPGEQDFVAHLADQFLDNLDQHVHNAQASDQGSSAGPMPLDSDQPSGVQSQFVQGQQQSTEIYIEDQMDQPVEATPEQAAMILHQDCSGTQEGTGQPMQPNETHHLQPIQEQKQGSELCLALLSQLNAQDEILSQSQSIRTLLQQLCSTAQIKIQSKTGANGTIAITRLTLTLPGCQDLVCSFPASEEQGQMKDSQFMSIQQVNAEETTNQVPST
jgi:hypothetical protein